ncbi:SulP family sulfate permease [Wenyingzhuangia heitensis]|uniref:SulP family sulfate permease n=1 Tax=Wenyingzhuangia heitensis TaxID=1487859 RepID=A0ABX0U4V6_9FLAO|nr:solute carrier family 23 protein [Wenyingzhuangia heitensis]NIJ43897.1 SulP family sulfate permease [Wenyingzhuangia heitensis]
MFKNFKGDLLGGITAGIVALPLALAFGVQSGLGASAGLYGAIFIGFFAALLGGTSTQISGPTAPMTAVSLLAVAKIVSEHNGNVSEALPFILFVFFAAGVFQIIFGVIRLGSLIKHIPSTVVSGFMSGIGFIILITQLPNLFGHKAGGVLGAVKAIPNAIAHINITELSLAMLTILIIYGFKRITKVIPSTLVALLVISTGSVFLLESGSYGIIGEIPEGFPKPNIAMFTLFSFRAFSPYILTAFSLALLGTIDSLLTSVVADNMTDTKHNSNKELIGQGIGNSIASIFGGIPGAGATIRTVVNIDAGGKTKLSGMVAGVLLLVILMVLGPLASLIPNAVLAGVLVTVGLGVMDVKSLKTMHKQSLSDVVVMLLVLTLTVFWDLIFAVAIGVLVHYAVNTVKVLSFKKSYKVN